MARVLGAPAGAKKIVSYRYEATSSRGRLVKGTIQAASEIEAERLLIARGDLPISVEVAPSMFSLEEALPTLFKVKPRDVIIFSRQLATLLRSGISLLPAMEVLYGQVPTSRIFKKMLGSIANDLRSGGSFTQSLAKHPAVFNEIYRRTITVGEQTGNMETVLQQMADYLEKQSELAGKIGKALTYPMMILGVGVVVIILMNELARFSRTMSVLIGTGLSLQEIMELAPQSSGNRIIHDALAQVNERLLLGEGLSEPMSHIDIFPPLLVQMVAVGEESNTLGFTLGVTADFYETTSAEKMNALVGLITPLSTIDMAILVGFIAISVLMPIYTLTGAFG